MGITNLQPQALLLLDRSKIKGTRTYLSTLNLKYDIPSTCRNIAFVCFTCKSFFASTQRKQERMGSFVNKICLTPLGIGGKNSLIITKKDYKLNYWV